VTGTARLGGGPAPATPPGGTPLPHRPAPAVPPGGTPLADRLLPPGGIPLADRLAKVLPVAAEHAAGCDERAEFPVAALAALRASGLMGLLVPGEYGGLGGSLGDLAAVAQALAGPCLSTAFIWAMHCQQVATIAAHAEPALKERLLPRIAAGEVYLASVTSERGTGGYLLTSLAPLAGDTGRLIIERDAPVVTGGEHADGFLITMQALGSTSPAAVTLVYAGREQLETSTYGDWNPMGMRATRSVGMTLSGEVPATAVIGGQGGFRPVAVQTFIPAGHIGWAATWLGSAGAALRAIIEMVRTPSGRKQLDPNSESFRHQVARVRIDLDLVSALLRQVIAEVEQPGTNIEAPACQLRLNGLKVAASELCLGAVDRMIQLTGLRHGYMRDSPLHLERAFRDLRSASLNYANERLLSANGALALLDRDVHLG
jgi:acyl-CoA dehydrogenase